MKIQRAEYEAQLAQRRYEEVDPSNRLVASTLESRWDQSLVNLEQTKKQYAEYQQTEMQTISEMQKRKIFSLVNDLPSLWNAPTTQAKDRKRILRLLIKDITVEKLSEPKQVMLHLRWQGGACEDIPLNLPLGINDRLRYPKEIVDKIRNLALTLTDDQIVAKLNQEGLLSAKGTPFNNSKIKWIRFKHGILTTNMKQPDEITVKEATEKFGVSIWVVYYWIERSIVQARQINHGSPYWIKIDDDKEKELSEWICNSSKITIKCIQHSKTSL